MAKKKIAKKKGVAKKAVVASPSPRPKRYRTNIDFQQPREISRAFAKKVQDLENMVGKPVWLFFQDGIESSLYGYISPVVRDAFVEMIREETPPGQKIAILIDSPGGMPQSAFQIASSIRKHCGGYDVLIPKYAKSAATLLSLGADNIIMSDDAELGPLDMQVLDDEAEDRRSVLEYVQSLERLEAYTMRVFDDAMTLLVHRTGKKVGTLIPSSVEFVTQLVRPLFENVDVVQYTQMARQLKVMEDYASRLLSRKMSQKQANKIASDLTSQYSDHSFVIDREEAERIGLKISDPDHDRDRILMDIALKCHRSPNLLGRIEEY